MDGILNKKAMIPWDGVKFAFRHPGVKNPLNNEIIF